MSAADGARSCQPWSSSPSWWCCSPCSPASGPIGSGTGPSTTARCSPPCWPTRIGLFVVFGLIMAAAVAANAAIAYRLRPRLGAGATPVQRRCWSATASCWSPASSWVDARRCGAWSDCSPAARRAARSSDYLGLAQRHAVQRSTTRKFGLDVSLLRLRLPVVAVRAVVRLRRAGDQRDRGGRRALHDGRAAAERAASGNEPGPPQAHLSILIGLAVMVQGHRLLVRPVRRWRSAAPTGCSPAISTTPPTTRP